MKDGKFNIKVFLNDFEVYISTICFFALTILLSLQVVSRYLLKHSFTWMEELGTIMFVWMIYLGISGAITHRKHLRIDFLLDALPFKVKRAMLIISNVVFGVFNVYICMILMNVMELLGSSSTIMLHIPNVLVYSVIPFSLILTTIRLVQDTIKLSKENASELGNSKPSLDLASCERDYQQKLAEATKGGDV